MMTSPDAIRCFGHDVPPFLSIFPKVFRAGVAVMSLEQIDAVASGLNDVERQALGNALGEEGMAALAESLPSEKLERLAAQYRPGGDGSPEQFRATYPRVAALTNNTLTLEQLTEVLGALSPEDIASQSFYFGNAGRRAAFEQIKPDRIQAILDHTEDWVFIETGKQALREVDSYTCTLEKQERVGRKLQDREVVQVKVRHRPACSYLKWIDGPFKGREVLHNPERFGPRRVRVREGGLLGVLPVTIDADSAVAKRGTKHNITEVGLTALVDLVEREFARAAPKGDLVRRNLGMRELDGERVYSMESVLPRDRSKGYYAYRTVHYMDYLRGLEVKIEVYDFDDKLDECFHYRNVVLDAHLGDADFDPGNKSYRL